MFDIPKESFLSLVKAKDFENLCKFQTFSHKVLVLLIQCLHQETQNFFSFKGFVFKK